MIMIRIMAGSEYDIESEGSEFPKPNITGYSDIE